MGFLLRLLGGGGIKGILAGVNEILGRFFKNRDKLEANIHSEQAAALNAFASEFHARSNRTWFDSLIDGLNRLPRPTMAFLVIGILVYAPVDPAGFIVIMHAYALVPEWLAVLLGVIAAFYFGSRHLENRLSIKGPGAQQIRAAAELRDRIERKKPHGPAGSRGSASAPAIGAPTPNRSIEAWRARARRGSG